MGDASLIRRKCDFTVNSGAADVEPRGSGLCVEDLDGAGSGDHQNSLSVVAEAHRPVVPAIGTKTPRRSRLFQRVGTRSLPAMATHLFGSKRRSIFFGQSADCAGPERTS